MRSTHNPLIFWLVRITSLIIAITVFTPGLQAASQEPLDLVTSRGERVQGMLHLPDSDAAKLPAIVIAPGQGYHMDAPLIVGVAQQAASNGIAAFRFNWHFFATSTQREKDRSHEIEDMLTVIQHAKAHPRIDPSRVILVGKSFGSIMTYTNYQRAPEAAGLVLLTPVCRNEKDMKSFYPGLANLSVPTVLLLGNRDKFCSLKVLYEGLQGAGNHIVTIVLPGNHSLALGPRDDPAFTQQNKQNVDLAVAITSHWLRTILAQVK